MNEIWEIAERKQKGLIDQLLVNRGVGLDVDSRRAFFEPNFETDLYDPFLMKGMREATSRIKLAYQNQEKIGIFADYDADGIPGAAVLYRALRKIGISAEVYIPDRESGYGLSKEGIDLLVSRGCALIISVDLGIKNFEEAKYCKENKIDLIVTDHHLPDADTPDAFVVINPKVVGNKYPDPNLCGCAVAFKLISALSKAFPEQLTESFLKWNLDLVAISTISDVVPLLGENRTLTKYGLIVLKKSRNLGLSTLIKIAGLEKDKVDAYTAGFQIGPRINAPGRMDSATKSFELLVSEDQEEAGQLAIWLNKKNEMRQKEMDSVIKQAILKVEEEKLDKNRMIILDGSWIKGVIGPSASRVCELFSRPVILFAAEGAKYTGSARSIEGINIVDLIGLASDFVERFGGHKGAAGLTVSKKNYSKFKKLILEHAETKISDAELVKRIKIDAEVKPEELTVKLCEELSKFEPFWMGNPKPSFMIKGVSFANLKKVGRDQNHLSLSVVSGSHKMRSILFNYEKIKNEIRIDRLYDIAFNPMINEWGGRKNVNLNINSLRLNEENS